MKLTWYLPDGDGHSRVLHALKHLLFQRSLRIQTGKGLSFVEILNLRTCDGD